MNSSIDRRGFLKMLSAGVAATALPQFAFAGAENRKLNVLFIAVDDLRPELGCYGHPLAKTPHIDKLASEGFRFTRTYCQQAVCAPSRISLLSGCRPDTTGVYDLKTTLRKAMPDVLSLPQHFKNNGYTTITLGKIYHHYGDDKIGWSEIPPIRGSMYCLEDNRKLIEKRRAEALAKGLTGFKKKVYTRARATEAADVPDNGYYDGCIADDAIKMLRKNKDTPFFLAAGFSKPHLPFNSPKKYWELYDRAKIPVPNRTKPTGAPSYAFTNWGELRYYTDIPKTGELNDAKTRELIHGYLASVSYVDAQIGRVLKELNDLGLSRNTVVILWGDHGWKLGEFGAWCKHTNFELDTRVPMILRAPGHDGGKACSALTEFVDIYPTLSELCGLTIPSHCEGTSMVPLLKNPGRKWKSAAFSQYPRGKIMGYSMRTERWRYTEWRQRGGKKKLVARELYDHRKSPIAGVNLAKNRKYKPVLNKLSKAMKAGWKAARPE